jgi:antitoxin component of MazEF toxin-antitoxin module
MEPTTLTLDERGAIILPAYLLQQYNLQAGDEFSINDVNGAFLLKPLKREKPVEANDPAFNKLLETIRDMLGDV